MFQLLSRQPVEGGLLSAIEALGIPASLHGELAREAFALWQQRAIELQP